MRRHRTIHWQQPASDSRAHRLTAAWRSRPPRIAAKATLTAALLTAALLTALAINSVPITWPVAIGVTAVATILAFTAVLLTAFWPTNHRG